MEIIGDLDNNNCSLRLFKRTRGGGGSRERNFAKKQAEKKIGWQFKGDMGLKDFGFFNGSYDSMFKLKGMTNREELLMQKTKDNLGVSA